jgi:uncharacterized membrane protein YfcA
MIEVPLGFVISVAIALTGVGAGSMTTPLLILLLERSFCLTSVSMLSTLSRHG